MKLLNIKKVIILGILSLNSVFLIQSCMENHSSNQQKEEFKNSKQDNLDTLKQDSLKILQFKDSVFIALNDVVHEIQIINKYNTEHNDAVKQIDENNYIVEIFDTIPTIQLENLLAREFEKRNIKEDFQYGIYDCYADSIIYENFICYNTKSNKYEKIDTMDVVSFQFNYLYYSGHFFYVIFPKHYNK